MSKQYLFYPKKGVISDSNTSQLQITNSTTNDIIVYQNTTNYWINTGSVNFINSLNLASTGFQGITGPLGPQGTSSGSSIINNGNTYILTSDGTSNGIIANTGLTYNGSILNIGGDVSPTGLFIESINSVLGVTPTIIDTTKQINRVSYNNNWISRFSSLSGSNSLRSIKLDNNNNVYAVGGYSQTGAIINSNGSTFQIIYGSGSNSILTKYGPTGMAQWYSTITSFSSLLYGLTNDVNNNTYVTGSITYPSSIYNSDGTLYRSIQSLTGLQSCIIIKYGTTGMVQWYSIIDNTTVNNCIGYDIVTDKDNNTYVTGVDVSPTVVYNSDGTAFKVLSGSGNNDCFIVKYGSTGMANWAINISGAGNDQGNGICVDTNSDIYVCGQFTSPATIYNSDGSSFKTLFGSGNNDCFVVKYGSTGMAQRSNVISGISSDVGNKIAVDTSTNSYVVGTFTNISTIYNSDGSAFKTLRGTGADCFLVNFSSTGSGQWVSTVSGPSADSGIGLGLDNNRNSYITGTFRQNFNIFNSDGTLFRNILGSGALNTDGTFIAKYGPTGMAQIGTKITSVTNVLGTSIVSDKVGSIYACGYFQTGAVFYNIDRTTFNSVSVTGNNGSYIYSLGYNYTLNDLTNSSTNNGKYVNVFNPTGTAVNVYSFDSNNNIYRTNNVTTSANYVSYEGKWYLTYCN